MAKVRQGPYSDDYVIQGVGLAIFVAHSNTDLRFSHSETEKSSAYLIKITVVGTF